MLRIAFAGTPDFAVPTLERLVQTPGVKVETVYTKPDRPSGRGRKLSESSVKQFAKSSGLLIRQPKSLQDPAEVALFQNDNLDALVVVAYGQMLRSAVLDSPRLGCLNVHASLLPRWRGAAPLQRAIQAGDNETGITIMQMDAGLDTGAILATQLFPITDETTTAILHEELAQTGASLLVKTLLELERGDIHAKMQSDSGATYAHKIATEDAAINWSHSSEVVLRHIHAFNPMPGAFCFTGDVRIKIFRVKPSPIISLGTGIIWKTPDGKIAVGTKNSVLEILECQLPGGRRIGVEQMCALSHAPWVVPTQINGYPT
ncbi:methionyl-tRNA formyltransferase [Litorivicinus sp.]|nr:methionyl-tRNA formyltransferase [Litorivicinus sp.]